MICLILVHLLSIVNRPDSRVLQRRHISVHSFGSNAALGTFWLKYMICLLSVHLLSIVNRPDSRVLQRRHISVGSFGSNSNFWLQYSKVLQRRHISVRSFSKFFSRTWYVCCQYMICLLSVQDMPIVNRPDSSIATGGFNCPPPTNFLKKKIYFEGARHFKASKFDPFKTRIPILKKKKTVKKYIVVLLCH